MPETFTLLSYRPVLPVANGDTKFHSYNNQEHKNPGGFTAFVGGDKILDNNLFIRFNKLKINPAQTGWFSYLGLSKIFSNFFKGANGDHP